MEPVKLGPSAALVMSWARPLYKDPRLHAFLEALDLSSAEFLSESLDEEHVHVRRQTILNRKYFIKERILQWLDKEGLPHDILILAAGRSPLGLELLLERYEQVNRVLEVDTVGLDEKSDIYREHYSEFAEKLECVTADVTFPERYLKGENSAPFILILEGISYYITQKDLVRILKSFGGRRGLVLLEYATPFDEIRPDRGEIAAKTFGAIQNLGGLEKIVCYRPEEISALFSECGGMRLADHSMAEMERIRLGENRFFYNVEDGWARCFVGQME